MPCLRHLTGGTGQVQSALGVACKFFPAFSVLETEIFSSLMLIRLLQQTEVSYIIIKDDISPQLQQELFDLTDALRRQSEAQQPRFYGRAPERNEFDPGNYYHSAS